MVGNKGKGSRSKSKALKPRPVEVGPEIEPELSQIGPNDSVDVASDGEDAKNDIPNKTEILLEEKMLTESVLSDGLENDQNSIEDNDLIKDNGTEIKVAEETINDVKEVNEEGQITTHSSVEKNEKRINADNPEEVEAPLKFDCNGEALTSERGLGNNVTDNLEDNKPVGTPSDREEQENVKENVNVSSEVKDVSGKVNRPTKKVMKKKLIKKKMVRRKDVPQTSDVNNASSKASEIDVDERVTIEEKVLGVNNASKEARKDDNDDHMIDEKEDEVKPSVMVNKKPSRIRKKKAQKPQSQKDESGNGNHNENKEAEVNNKEVEKYEDKGSPLKSDKKKKIAKQGSQEVVSKDVEKPKEGKKSKKVESMGMIFMCSSETKKDCFRYKVLGLPASKKDMVLKIYKGMRVFLFDVDLRIMYGIYKAAGPGGYNIEPRAFKSQFPSQVRFTVLEDCVPLAEERFKKVLKDNYYSKNKFNFQLNHDQVKNLCKLFHETNKKVESTKAANRSQRAAPTSSIPRQDNKRKRVDDTRRAVAKRAPPPKRERSPRRAHKETRRAPLVISDRYHERPTYERETYIPSIPPVHIYQPLPPPRSPPQSRTYTYESYDRLLGVNPYRRETVIDSWDLASSRELGVPSRYESYLPYREPPQAYSSGTRRENYEYGTSGSERRYVTDSEYYRTSDYRPAPPPPLYRRY